MHRATRYDIILINFLRLRVKKSPCLHYKMCRVKMFMQRKTKNSGKASPLSDYIIWSKATLNYSFFTIHYSFNKQRLTCHLCRLLNAHNVEHCGSDITELAAVFLKLAVVTDNNKGNGIGCVCGEG